jgi:hypothetical protein
MKELFPSYYRLTDEELKTLWSESLVAFDTNSLLNIYKYPKDAQQDMLRAMKAVQDRLLLPHHVALEFNRHRLGVIAEQVDTYDKVAKIVKDMQNELTQKLDKLKLVKLHSQIDPTPLTESISQAADDFLEKLKVLKQKQPKVHEEDKLRQELDQLFQDRIVGGFPDQNMLDLWGDEAEDRFLRQVPPGFEDAKAKAKHGTDLEFTFDGLRYKNKYGDYILWRQLLEAVETRGVPTNLILVTDDSKSDWWNEIRSEGNLKVGVHPNLVEEFRRYSDGGFFQIYSSEGFLIEAKRHLKVTLANTTVSRVRDIAEVGNETESGFTAWAVESTFFHMLRSNYPGDWVDRRSFFPDFIVNSAEQVYAYDLKYLRRPLSYHVFPIIEKTRESVERYREAGRFTTFELSFIVTSEEHASQITHGIESTRTKLHIPFQIGIYVISQDDGERFPRLERVS